MSKKRKGLGKFITGIMVGAGLGVLFAPQKGEKTREELKAKINELFKKIKEIDVAELKEDLENKLNEIKKQITELDRETALEIAKEKGKQLKEKTEELVKLAVKKGTPVLKKAAEQVKDKSILVLKDVIEKLEKTEEEAE